jgi:hypothetical protein
VRPFLVLRSPRFPPCIKRFRNCRDELHMETGTPVISVRDCSRYFQEGKPRCITFMPEFPCFKSAALVTSGGNFVTPIHMYKKTHGGGSVPVSARAVLCLEGSQAPPICPCTNNVIGYMWSVGGMMLAGREVLREKAGTVPLSTVSRVD